ncbi:hypothetical protein BURPS1710b_A2564 [Burkholderia pseudomallei 1710b]|uniref:Uncharacterized protein n=1 Tax=Burkholderia pseudomallei (strain 1710b) TaxID=320372 RepID=Q3JFD9_BURP1|nr:hypothetical protein BURPS1710b_A2564 [Burkholderia pseudomallei 1710b]
MCGAISTRRWADVFKGGAPAASGFELIELALQLAVARDARVDRAAEPVDERADQQVEQARERRERIPELADVGLHLQQVARQLARPRAVDVGDEREAHAARAGRLAIAPRDARVRARVGDDAVRIGEFGIQRIDVRAGHAVRIEHARAQVFEVAVECVADPARRLDAEDEHRVGLRDAIRDLREARRARELVHMADRVELARERVVERAGRAARRGLVARRRVRARHATVFVEAVGDHPGALGRAAQLALQVVEIAIADAAQEAPDRDAARAGLARDLVRGFEAQAFKVREHVARDALGRGRELGKAGFDGLDEGGRHGRVC